MQNRTVLISGASIAGPALAYWLRRYGFTPTVVERAPALRDGGYKIDVRGPAAEVLRRTGVYDEVTAASTDMRSASFVNGRGKRFATVSADFFMGREHDDVELMRGDLSRILYRRTNDVEYLFGDSIASLTDTVDGVEVTFERAAPRRFDLVVGADGLHSHTRGLVFGDEAQFIRHLGAYISIFSVPNHLGLDREELYYSTLGRIANVYSTGRGDGARALFIFGSEPLAYDRRDTVRQRELLTDAYAGLGWEVPRLMRELDRAPDFYFDSLSQVKLDRWHSGRVALLGDAAYCPSPASGQGTSLALVGAYVLAGELAAAGGDHRTAFPRYQETLRHYVDENLRLGQNMADQMIPKSRSQLWIRTQLMRVLPYLPWQGMVTKQILEPIRRAANAIELPEYAPVPATAG